MSLGMRLSCVFLFLRFLPASIYTALPAIIPPAAIAGGSRHRGARTSGVTKSSILMESDWASDRRDRDCCFALMFF